MPIHLILALSFFLMADADVPRINSLRPLARNALVFPPGEEIPLFPDSTTANDAQGAAQTAPAPKGATLQDSTKLELIRYVSGEFAKAIKSLPAGKEGLIVYVGKPIPTDMLERALATHGAAVNSGDSVQITKLDFQGHQIIVDLNGGGRGKKRLRDRFHIEMGGIPTMTTTTPEPQETGPPGLQPGMGSTLYLDFGKTIPDLSPADLKQLLSPFLDFTRQRSASLQWVDTLPPEMKKAIQERRAMVGMDREEVVAAIGKPDHKVRERDNEGNDIEDWIYGQPPSKTVFVRFNGDRVTNIRQYPQ